MSISYKSPHNFRVGDLVCLSYDEYRQYGFGIVLWTHKNGEYEVYWFSDNSVDLETGFDILPAELTTEQQ